MKIQSPHISLSGNIRHRKESFGGILFNTATGTMIDVDREAYLLILLIDAAGIVDINDIERLCFNWCGRKIDYTQVKQIIKKLLDLDMLAIMPQGILHKNCYDVTQKNEQRKIKWPSGKHLSAPETVHWAVTFKCDDNCPDCYIRRHRYEFMAELETSEAMKIIDNISAAGVFQLAIGGGEPFLRSDIIRLAARACERELVVHITTGRYNHDPAVLKNISRYVKSMQIGIKHNWLIERPEDEKEKLAKLLYMLGEHGIDCGANVILSRSVIDGFDKIIDLLSGAGFKRITLLRYKPPGDINRWLKEKPDADDLLQFERKLLQTVDTYPHIQFRIDCGLAFLERDLPSQMALRMGIRGCVAAGRILSVAPDGAVFPCSQMVGDRFLAGNLLDDDLKNVWNNSKVLVKHRFFRESQAFKKGQCGHCMARAQCGGCRVFSDDALGVDPGCPDPLLPPSKRGKFINNDLYNTILDIQDSIGCTEGGAPFASLEEIKKWLDEENHYGYPKWLIK